MWVIGVTGGLATGKSTVAGILKGLGAKVLDADVYARRCLEKKGTCYRKVISAFGREILDKKGNIDRKRLASIVFADQKKLAQLTKIVHPVVVREIRQEIKKQRARKKPPVLVIDAPLLIEAGLDQDADLLVVVKASRKKQLERAYRKAKLSQAQALRRIRQQMPIRKKIQRADVVIDNRKNLKETEKQVHALWQTLKRRKRTK